MQSSVFKTLRTDNDVNNLIANLQSISEEHFINFESLLKVTDFDKADISYLSSFSQDGFVNTNFFQSQDKETGLWGLWRSKQGSTTIERFVDDKYVQFVAVSMLVWLCRTEDCTFDLIVDGEKLLGGIISYDVLSLSDCLVFLQLDTSSNRSLVCIDTCDINNGVFIPKDLMDFSVWYDKKVQKLGYDGSLNGVAVSDIFAVKNEVIQCIFMVADFKSIIDFVD